MGLITKPYTFTPNTLIESAEINQNFDEIIACINGNITAANLASNAVSTTKIQDSAVTADKLATDAVTTNKIEDGAVTTDKIDDGAVTADKIEDNIQFNTFPLTPAEAPDSDYEVANKKYVDDSITTAIGGYYIDFGTPESKNFNTVYQAETAGFVVAHTKLEEDDILIGYTDSNNPPTTIIARQSEDSLQNNANTITFPVKKGNYWKVTTTETDSKTALYWIPITLEIT